MQKTDYVFIVDFSGEWALFTMPECKVERVSYPFATPSALRGALKCVFWKPRIEYQIERIEVLNPIEYISVTTNEVCKCASYKVPFINPDEHRDIRHSRYLKNVRYRAWIRILFYEDDELPEGMLAREAGTGEYPSKYNKILKRRLSNGQFFKSPYLGVRECRADLRLVEEADLVKDRPIELSLPPRPMLYDIDYRSSELNRRIMFMAEMKNGVIEVPDRDSNQLFYI